MSELTTVGLVQDELAARLAARPRLQQGVGRPARATPCGVGWPDGGPQAPEHVWLDGAIEDWTIEQSTTGFEGVAPQAESYNLVVNFLVTLGVTTFAAVRDAALELAGELQTLLRVDRTLGRTVESAVLTGGKLSESYTTDNGRQCLVELTVHIDAYLDVTTIVDG